MKVAVFLSSSGALEDRFYKLAEEFGEKLAKAGHTLVYGGANVGMMKTLANAAKLAGAKIIGVIPDFFVEKGLKEELADEVHIVKSMAERKQKLIEISEAFVVLPGGFGTLDEFFEVLVLKQINQINAPIVLLNFDGFYDKLLEQIELIFKLNFAKPINRKAFKVVDSVDDVFKFLENYQPILDEDWFKVSREDFEKQN